MDTLSVRREAPVVFSYGIEDHLWKDQDNMKHLLRTGVVCAAFAASMGMATTAHAQDSETASAFAEILEAITLTKNTDLDFGAVVLAGGVAGTVTLDPTDGSRDCDGASGNILCSGTTALATFSINGGTTGKTVRIDFSGVTDLTIDTPSGVAGADETIALGSMTTDQTFVAAAGSDPSYYTTSIVGGGSTTDFAVGGTISFDGVEGVGTYTGSFDVAVDYL